MLRDIFGSGPNFELFQPIKGELTWLWGLIFGIGLLLVLVVFVINTFRIGTSGSDVGKAAGGIMGLKNVMLALGLLLIGLPLLLVLIEGTMRAF